ncbi:hypothetical protein E3N88_17940 [Mikania micrantha]|uniref:Endoplasmic reticulum vesicle transporter C-terminal domain-containing protein n=1 Tax=Mikania micrantha TaxID=192012 RepID=A0A5N6NTU0_9ASTR|nr:hypothetical protein E3N88_17940 [Mikania micrantha]
MNYSKEEGNDHEHTDQSQIPTNPQAASRTASSKRSSFFEIPWIQDPKLKNVANLQFLLSKSDDECCNSCEEVREAYRRKGWGMANPDLIDQCKREGFAQRIKDEEGEGCNIYGSLEVNKVAGSFHFIKSFHQSSIHILDLLTFNEDSYNISHKINKLAFGDYYPGIVNPLDGVHWFQETPNGMYEYFIKVVPTIYTNIRGHSIKSNQFSVTEHYKRPEFGRRSLPGVFFFYDLSPIKVTFMEKHTSFLHFLTNVCAIVGGIFTVAGIVDSFIYHGHKALRKKMEIGKLG